MVKLENFDNPAIKPEGYQCIKLYKVRHYLIEVRLLQIHPLLFIVIVKNFMTSSLKLLDLWGRAFIG